MVAVEPRERLEAFVADVFDGFDRRSQRINGQLYVRGLIEQGPRKSLQPTLFRLGEPAARYESMQQFVADPRGPTMGARPLLGAPPAAGRSSRSRRHGHSVRTSKATCGSCSSGARGAPG